MLPVSGTLHAFAVCELRSVVHGDRPEELAEPLRAALPLQLIQGAHDARGTAISHEHDDLAPR